MVSDDETDNCDTPILRRWRRNYRAQRIKIREAENEEQNKKRAAHQKRLADAEMALENEKKRAKIIIDLEKALEEAHKEGDALRKQEEGWRKAKRMAAWNVYAVSKPGFNDTAIDSEPGTSSAHLIADEKSKKTRDFIKKNEKLVRQYGMLHQYSESRRFLNEHRQLVCEDTSEYLFIWCIDMAIAEKYELLPEVARQALFMQYIMEAAKHIGVSPRNCIDGFFVRVAVANGGYEEFLSQELQSFIDRIKEHAKKRLELGGLAPMEVFEELPDNFKRYLTSKNGPMLQKALGKLPPQEADNIKKKMVDSGLWVPEKFKEIN